MLYDCDLLVKGDEGKWYQVVRLDVPGHCCIAYDPDSGAPYIENFYPSKICIQDDDHNIVEIKLSKKELERLEESIIEDLIKYGEALFGIIYSPQEKY